MDSLYELTWWVPAAMAIGGIVLFWMGNNQLSRPMKWSGLGVFLLAIGLAVFSIFMESEREKVVRRSGELVKAIEKRDRAALLARLHPNVKVLGLQGREKLADAAIGAADVFKLQSTRVVSIVAEEDQGLYSVRMQVSAQFDHPSLSNWRLDWVPSSGEWVLGRAESEGGLGFDSTTIEGIMERWRR